MKTKLILSSPELKARAKALIDSVPMDVVHQMEIKEWRDTRSSQQNRLLWSMLHDISQQIVWHGRKLTDWNWKDILSASLKQQEVVPGLDNNFVVLGAHTSKMSIAEMSEMIELMTAFGLQQGVKFKAPKWMEE